MQEHGCTGVFLLTHLPVPDAIEEVLFHPV